MRDRENVLMGQDFLLVVGYNERFSKNAPLHAVRISFRL